MVLGKVAGKSILCGGLAATRDEGEAAKQSKAKDFGKCERLAQLYARQEVKGVGEKESLPPTQSFHRIRSYQTPVQVMEASKFADGKIVVQATSSHSLDAQGVHNEASNDGVSKTFGHLPTEIRLLSKLSIRIYLLLRFIHIEVLWTRHYPDLIASV